jgi:hypothetical protein
MLCWGLSKFVMLISFLRSRIVRARNSVILCVVQHTKKHHMFLHIVSSTDTVFFSVFEFVVVSSLLYNYSSYLVFH